MDAKNLLRDAPKGEVTMKDDRMQVVFRRRYAKPVAKLWAALTTPERLEDWLGAAKIELRVGGALRITAANGKVLELSVSRVDPPHVLGWSWEIDGLNTSVLFELAPDGDGCRLTLTHSGLNARGRGAGVRAGWHAVLEGLADSLDGRATPWAVKEQREAAVAPLYPPLPA
ncbi:MAG TPA: SRPBCC family protein [Candidatus Udaeobacter sp.]|nr:SRPBCC family protein [Candidatus Udaeobacter sp.]